MADLAFQPPAAVRSPSFRTLERALPKNFGVNLRQVVRLLGERLYLHPYTAIRELVQNSYDAVLRRLGPAVGSSGRITILIDRQGMAITFCDNGTGMNRFELETYLSTLGDGIKIHQDDRVTVHPGTIGEYGIGFFSAFMIADRITVRTRREGEVDGSVWSSSGTEGYDIESDPNPLDGPGTWVTLHLQRRTALTYLNEERLAKVVHRYCEFLDCEIRIGSHTEPCNSGTFAWELQDESARSDWFKTHLDSDARYTHCGTVKVGRIMIGYAFACGGAQVDREQKIYVKRMFVTDTLRFVDDYLGFISVIIATDSLNLDLGRSGIKTDSTATRVFEIVEQRMLDWMIALVKAHKGDPELIGLIHAHQRVFKKLAVEKSAFFEKVCNHLVFTLTNGDLVTIAEYLSLKVLRDGIVLCTASRAKGALRNEREQFLLEMCTARQIPVIGISDEDEDELVRRVCTRCHATRLRLVDAGNLLEQVAGRVNEAVERVRANIERFVNRTTVVVDFPNQLSALAFGDGKILLNGSNEFVKRLGELTVDYERIRPVYESLVRLSTTIDRAEVGGEERAEIVRGEMRALEKWTEAVERWQEDWNRLSVISGIWWKGPAQLEGAARGGQQFVSGGRKYSRRAFIVCPFSEPYRDFVNVVVSVAAEYEILAETAEAPETIEILHKVCRYVDKCDFAIIDVSENNPNVLFELGVVMARRKPAIIACSKERRELTRVSVPTDLIGIERLEYSNTSEDLRAKLKGIFERLRS